MQEKDKHSSRWTLLFCFVDDPTAEISHGKQVTPQGGGAACKQVLVTGERNATEYAKETM